MTNDDLRLLDKIQGCLLGGAAGDALGYPVEFMSWQGIQKKYGAAGITEYDPDAGTGLAQISDDTQMTLFTANAAIVSAARADGAPSVRAYRETAHHAYLDWYKTQTCRSVFENKWRTCWLMDVPELYADRAPGTTCMSALASGDCGSLAYPINDSKGCGGVMRAAPVGCFFRDAAPEEVVALGAETAAVTHGNTLGTMPAGMLALLVRLLIRDRETSLPPLIRACCESVEKVFSGDPQLPLFLRQIETAVQLASGSRSDAENIRALGQGWTGDEALAIALYCSLRYSDNFSLGIRAAVNHSGDSDSTGAIAGNILGAALGLSGIDLKWREKLEHRNTIIEMANDLYRVSALAAWGKLSELPETPSLNRKYIEMRRDARGDASEAGAYFMMPDARSVRTLFVNPRKALRKTLVGRDGTIHGYPGIANPKLIAQYCSAMDLLYPGVRYTAWYMNDGDERRMIWEIHPDGEYWRDEDGFGEEDDTEVDLYAGLDDEGNFTGPFRIYKIGSTCFRGTDREAEDMRAFLEDERDWSERRRAGMSDTDIISGRAAAVLADFAARREEWPLSAGITIPPSHAYVSLSTKRFKTGWNLALGGKQGKYGAVEVQNWIRIENGDGGEDALLSEQTLEKTVDWCRGFLRRLD